MHLFLAIMIAVMSPEQRDVWSGEQRYWDLRAAGKIDEYMALWDDEFTGWPQTTKEPIGKDGIRAEVLRQIAEERGTGGSKVTLEPLSVRIHGDFAFVFYRVHFEKASVRIHHTWRRTPAGWKIIAGMSAPDEQTQ